jgi:hypothetical protein
MLNTLASLTVFWLAIRLYMKNSKCFTGRFTLNGEEEIVRFDFDMTHHYDLGFVLASWGVLVKVPHPALSLVWVLVGLFTMLDDVIGHYRAAHGKPESWVLEPIFMPILKYVWKH